MSRWHRENPELYEQGYEPWDDLERQADALRKSGPRDSAADRPLRVPADQRHADTPTPEDIAEGSRRRGVSSVAHLPDTDAYRERVNEIEQERHLEAEDREHRRREEQL